MANVDKSERSKHKQDPDKRASYESPAIIYEGVISTRAGTPFPGSSSSNSSGPSDQVDPADLFGD